MDWHRPSIGPYGVFLTRCVPYAPKLRPPESTFLMHSMHLSPYGVRYRRSTLPQAGHCLTEGLSGGSFMDHAVGGSIKNCGKGILLTIWRPGQRVGRGATAQKLGASLAREAEDNHRIAYIHA
jgi:hypothetical protein